MHHPSTRQSTQSSLRDFRDLFGKAKALNDFVTPNEYGLNGVEKLDIALLYSNTLLNSLIDDLESFQAHPTPRTRLYFTKESHMQTLHSIIRNRLCPGLREAVELDYL